MIANYFSIMDIITGGAKCFFVPVYQRPYSWTKENCIRLLKDVLENKKDKYFLGSIVLYDKGRLLNEAAVQGYELVDGQQRLTTLMLIFKALGDFNKDMQSYCKGFTANLNVPLQNKKYELKLQYDIKSEDVFRKIIHSEDISLLSSALKTNFLAIKAFLSDKDPSIVYNALLRLHIIEIRLDSHDEPQIIFETLNSTGVPLKKYELIKNFLMLGGEKEEVIQNYNEYLKPLEELIPDTKIDEFIRTYLILKTTNEVKIAELYMVFKSVFNKTCKSREAFLKELLKMARHYACIALFEGAKYKNDKIKESLEKLDRLGFQKNVAPFLMYLLEKNSLKELGDEELLNAIFFIHSFLLRRCVCEYKSNQLTSIFYPLVKHFEDRLHLCASDNLSGILQGKNRYPSDDEFKKALIFKALYKPGKQAKQILLMLLQSYDESKNPKEKVSSKSLTLEHIAPQSVDKSKEWLVELGNDFKKLEAKDKENTINSLGNITLINNSANAKMGAKNFSSKKEIYKNSNFAATRELSEFASFSLDALLKRGEVLAKMLVGYFSLPAVNAKNIYQSSQKQKSELLFDLFEEDFDPSSTTLNKLSILNKISTKEDIIKPASWADAYRQLLGFFYKLNKDKLIFLAKDENIAFLSTQKDDFAKYAYPLGDEHLFARDKLSSKQILLNLKKLMESFEGYTIIFSIKNDE